MSISQENQRKEVLRECIIQWFVGQCKYSHGEFYRVVDEDTKIVARWPRDEIRFEIIRKARELCQAAFSDIGAYGHLWPNDHRYMMEQIEAIATATPDNSIVAVGDTPVSGDFSDRPWAVNRLPVDFGIAAQMPPEDHQMALDIIMTKLPEFYHDLRRRMVSPEMWDILTCFFGRMVSEDKPSSEFVYWHGPGGDGKGTLTEIFFEMMPDTSTPVSHSLFESRFGADAFADKRFVRIDETPPGNFFTEKVKEVTGGSQTLSVERKYQRATKVKSRLALMFVSNASPAFSGDEAQERRLRVVEVVKRTSETRTAEELQNELVASFGAFLGYCLINYERCGRKIPKNTYGHLEILAADTHNAVDSWIAANLEYMPLSQMTNGEITGLIGATNGRLSISAVARRLAKVIVADDDSHPVRQVIIEVDGRRQRTWLNIQPKNRAFGGMNRG
jgi:hypothetical protein